LRLPSRVGDQKRIADLLWSIDEVIEHWIQAIEMLISLYKRYGCDHLLSGNMGHKELCNVADINMGQSPPGNAYNDKGDGMPFLQGNAEFGEISPKHIKCTTVTTKIASKGDILLSVRAPVGEINVANRQYCIGRGLSALSMKDKELNNFLKHLLIFLRPDLEKKSTGSTFKAINKHVLETVSIPFGKKNELLSIASRLEAMDNVKKKMQSNIQTVKCVQKQIINQIFG
jgi:type I restriction enzyme S subunit